MKTACVCLAAWLAWMALPAVAADAALATVADGGARVLRGTLWYKLVPGAAIQDGDLIDIAEGGQVQIEFTAGARLNLVGPGSLFAAALPWRNDKLDGPIELGLERGWVKLSATAPGVVTRIRTPAALVSASESTIVTRQDGKLFELFVESGNARISEASRTGRDGPPHDAKAGEYWARDGDKPYATERRAPAKFVASMPRHMLDRLAILAPRFKGPRPTLAVDREISLAEADPWLTGTYRRAFARRLGSRLADPTFRKAVEANIAAYPDFDRVLHPEKYPAQPGAAPPPAAGGPAPTPGGPAPPAVVPKSAAAPPPASASPNQSKSAGPAPLPPTPAAPKPGPRSALPFALAGPQRLPFRT